jgi:hypothetical protein
MVYPEIASPFSRDVISLGSDDPHTTCCKRNDRRINELGKKTRLRCRPKEITTCQQNVRNGLKALKRPGRSYWTFYPEQTQQIISGRRHQSPRIGAVGCRPGTTRPSRHKFVPPRLAPLTGSHALRGSPCLRALCASGRGASSVCVPTQSVETRGERTYGAKNYYSTAEIFSQSAALGTTGKSPLQQRLTGRLNRPWTCARLY